VFLVVPHGFSARSLLRTEILPTLRTAGCRVVILTPNFDEPYMRAEFDDEGIRLAPLRSGADAARGSRVWWLLYHLRRYTLARAWESRAFMERYASLQTRLRRRRFLLPRCIALAVAALWRLRALRGLLLWLEMRLFAPGLHRDVFDAYPPDLVVTTSPGWFLSDAVVLREARRRGVPSAAVVLGWDNPTSKGYRGADPDRILVWSERMAEQVASRHDFPRDRIVVAGVPQLDVYSRPNGLPSRAELFRQLDLDDERRLIVFATSSPGAYRHSLHVAESLARAIAGDELPAPAQLVVRIHPINFRPDYRTSLTEFEALRERYPHVHLDVPEVRSQRLRCDVPRSDNMRLAGLIRSCDVLVNVFSTTALEACLADRPVVMVGPHAHLAPGEPPDEGPAEHPRPRRFDAYEHMSSVIRDGAVDVAGSMPELISLVRDCLAQPSARAAARRRVARRECGPCDGQAGVRIGRVLLELAELVERPAAGATAVPGPTMFLVITQGFAARTLLRTEVLPSLLSAGARIVALVPNPDEPYMREEFEPLGVELESLRAERAKRKATRQRFLYRLRSFTLGNAEQSPAFVRKYRMAAERWSYKYPRELRWTRPALALLWRFRALRRLLVVVEARANATKVYGELFRRYRPDLVVTTSPGHSASEVAILREAAARGVRTAAFILGWDNPTSKGYRGATPDRVLAWSDRMASQLVEFQDIPRRRIAVTGVPHFDRYAQPGALPSWDALCAQAGLDPSRRLILFATSAPGAFAHNGVVAETLARAIDGGALEEAQLVIRVHPIHFRVDHGGVPAELRAVADGKPHVHLDLPQVLSDRLRCDLPADDSVRLGALLRHCAVLVNAFSTTTLEAFLLDRPVVMVAPESTLDPGASAMERATAREVTGSWEDYAHMRDLVRRGAARVARSMPELIELVRLYMERPELDRARRHAVGRDECGAVDGHAGERVAGELLALWSEPGR
jgi:CDP-glycerol glycerophosphotransferase (TagB/SpsB family)